MSNEEASPFGCMTVNRDLDEGFIMQPDNTVSILDSPFSSANVYDEVDNGAKGGRKPQDKQQQQQQQQQLHNNTTGGPGSRSKDANNTLPSGSGSTATAGDWACGGVDSGAMNTPSANGVADILESPFVSACLSQDLKNIEADLAVAAAAAEELANATAAVNISKT